MGIYDKYPVFRIVFSDSWFYKKCYAVMHKAQVTYRNRLSA